MSVKSRPSWPELPMKPVCIVLAGVIMLEATAAFWAEQLWHSLLLRGAQAAWMLGCILHFSAGRSLGVRMPDSADLRVFLLTAVICTAIAALILILPMGMLDRVVIPAQVTGWQGIVLLLLLAPLAEELFFRGFVYGMLRQGFGAGISVVVSSFCFGLMHGPQFLPQLAGGVAFAIAYEFSRNLWVPVALHMGANAAVLVIVLLR